LKDLVFRDCKPGSLEVKEVEVAKTFTEPTKLVLTATLSGKIKELKWPSEKKYGWRSGASAISWSVTA
jgi:hypothetical protein